MTNFVTKAKFNILSRQQWIAYFENIRYSVGDVSVAAGPVGAEAGVATATPEVYAYVSSFGAFVGATVQGTVLSFDLNANRNVYEVADPLRMEARAILGPAQRLSCAVDSITGAPKKFCG